jgi:hypothetical protein
VGFSVVAAIVLAVIAGLSFGEITNVWPPSMTGGRSRHITLACFVIAFLVLMPVFYIMILKEGDDYLTPLRNQLKGNWSVYYQDYEVGPTGAIISTEQNDTAKLDINVVTRKLYIQNCTTILSSKTMKGTSKTFPSTPQQSRLNSFFSIALH